MGSGNCIFWAPDTFDLSDDGHAVVTDAAATDEERLRIAAQGCPVGAISLWRDGAEVLARGEDVMPIAVTEDHESLRRTALRWTETHCPATGAAPGGRGADRVGWSCRRSGRRWPPRAGSACTCARSRADRASRWPSSPSCSRSSVTRSSPGRCCPPSLVSAALARGAARAGDVPPEWLPGLADGSITAAVALGAAPHPWRPVEDGGAGPRRRGAPGARAARRPPRPGPARPRRRRPAGSCSIGRRSATRVSVEALPALDGTRAVGQLTIAGEGRVTLPAARAGPGLRRRRARPRPDAGGGRERRHRALVPGHGVGLRQGARPVRPAHRPVPGGQARAGRHARRGRAERRGRLGRRRRLERGRRRAGDDAA